MARLNSTMYPKLTEEAVSNLQNKNIFTVFDFIPEEPEKLTTITGLTYKESLDLKQNIVESFGGEPRKGSDLLNRMRDHFIPTGIESLDLLLEGGLCAGQIYELCGLSSSGKTQLCHIIAINVTQKSIGTVHYIDAKRDFCATRVQMILESRKCDDEETGRVLDRIKVTRVRNILELLSTLHILKVSLNTKSEDCPPLKIVIIDSLPAIFFQSSANEPNFENISALNHLSNVMRYCASEYNIVFITVNLITRWREQEGFFTAENDNARSMKPALGKYWLHIPNTRLLIKILEKDIRKISVWKSLQLKLDSSCSVNITDA